MRTTFAQENTGRVFYERTRLFPLVWKLRSFICLFGPLLSALINLAITDRRLVTPSWRSSEKSRLRLRQSSLAKLPNAHLIWQYVITFLAYTLYLRIIRVKRMFMRTILRLYVCTITYSKHSFTLFILIKYLKYFKSRSNILINTFVKRQFFIAKILLLRH